VEVERPGKTSEFTGEILKDREGGAKPIRAYLSVLRILRKPS
jgi:hypothetical protein